MSAAVHSNGCDMSVWSGIIYYRQRLLNFTLSFKQNYHMTSDGFEYVSQLACCRMENSCLKITTFQVTAYHGFGMTWRWADKCQIYKECNTWILQFLFIKIPLKHHQGTNISHMPATESCCSQHQRHHIILTDCPSTTTKTSLISDLQSISHITALYLSDKTLEYALEPSHISFLWLNWNKLPEPSAKLLFESQHLQTALWGSIYLSSLPNPLYAP